MNRFHHLLLLALLGLITACSYNELPENLSPLTIENDGLVLQVETRAETYKGQSLDQEYFVTAEDLENFVKYRRSASKRSDLTVKEVKSYGFDSSQTLFYILNYDQGWEVISADKRIQPTLAHGDSGEFTMDSDNEAMKLWMNMIADGVLQMRLGNVESKVATASSESKDSADEPTSDHTAFWDAISPTKASRTRGDLLIPIWGPLDTLIIYPPTPPAEVRRYYIPNAVFSDAQISTTGTQVATKWGQQNYWNRYCPYKMSDSNSRVPAGCTAVAGAQLLYYLAHNLEWNLSAPSYAHCEAQLPNKEQTFDDFSSQVWNFMALSVDDSLHLRHNSAKLIAHVGKSCDMDYGDDGSGASLTDLKNGLLNDYSISSSITSYNSSTVIADLRNNPVVVGAYRDWLGRHGHTWLIDEYRVMHVETTRYYIETTEVLTNDELWQLTIEDATGYIVEHSTSTHFHMNWGWEGYDNGYYGLATEAWDTRDYDAYQYYADILYNFNLEED